MPYPDPPSIDIPRWAYSGGTYTEPNLTKRQLGWVAVPGQNYGEIPPYQWMNWLQYSTGEWINYFNDAINYIENGSTQPRRAVIWNDAGANVSPAGGVLLPFDSVNYFNTLTTPWNTSTNTFTVPEASNYYITTNIFFQTTGSSSSGLIIYFKVNGLDIYYLFATGSFPTSGVVSANVYFPGLTAGITIQFFASSLGGTFQYGGPHPNTISQQNSQLLITWNT